MAINQTQADKLRALIHRDAEARIQAERACRIRDEAAEQLRLYIEYLKNPQAGEEA